MTDKTTPGPWVHNIHEVLTPDKRWRVASVHGQHCSMAEWEANAQLISAAPELADFARNVAGLDAEHLAGLNLHDLRSLVIEYQAIARAALTKAEG